MQPSVLKLLMAICFALMVILRLAQPVLAQADTVNFEPWMNNFRKQVYAKWNAPRVSKSASVIVFVGIKKSGEITDLKVLQSSGFVEIDQSAILAVQKAKPFQPLPIAYTGNPIEIKFTFHIGVCISNRQNCKQEARDLEDSRRVQATQLFITKQCHQPPDEAVTEARKLFQDFPVLTSLHLLLNALNNAGYWAEGLEIVEQNLIQYPEDRELILAKIMLLFSLNRLEEAKITLAKIPIPITQDDLYTFGVDYLTYQGNLLFEEGKRDDALIAWEKAATSALVSTQEKLAFRIKLVRNKESDLSSLKAEYQQLQSIAYKECPASSTYATRQMPELQKLYQQLE